MTTADHKDLAFYVKPDLNITYYESGVQDEEVAAEQGRSYLPVTLIVDDDPVKVNSKLSVIAAVAFKSPQGTGEVRQSTLNYLLNMLIANASYACTTSKKAPSILGNSLSPATVPGPRVKSSILENTR